MADIKITELPELAVTPADDDVVAIVDIDAGPATTKKITFANLVGTQVFGSEFQEESSLGDSTTSSTSFVSKLILTTPVVPAGTYRVAVSFNWNYNNLTRNFLAQIDQDSGTIVGTFTAEPADPGTSQDYIVSKFAYVILTNAVHTFDLQFAVENAADVALIDTARIEFWRVS